MFNRWIEIPGTNCLLLGPRRAGKTTLLRARLPAYQYVTLDDLDLLSWAKKDPKGFVEALDSEAIVDEIQRAPVLTIALKKRIDEGTLRVVMTGSSSIGLLDATAESLAGRIHIRHLPPMCWGEEKGTPTHRLFEDRMDPPDLMAAHRLLEQALTYGGFPEILIEKDPEAKRAVLRTFRDSYFTRDLAQLSQIENVEGLLAILQHIGQCLGSLVEISSFAREAGLSHPTAKKYITTLLQSDLAFKLYGYHLGTAKRYISSAKMYFCDSGVPTALRCEISAGQRFESFVISELEKRRKLGFFSAEQLFYYRSTGGLEIDLLAETEKELILVEIKSSEYISTRDTTNLREYAAHSKRRVRPFIIYRGTEYREIEHIRCIPAAALFRSR